MLKTFIFGMLLGISGAAALLWFAPVVDQQREGSLIRVRPNGGNFELFQIILPHDRILAGVASADETVPAGLEWPQDEIFADLQTELFKLRDRNDVIVGVAGRIASDSIENPFIHWMLHLPARGSMFLDMGLAPTDEGHRAGILQAGTREFAELSGSVRERYFNDVEQAEFEIEGRIELTTLLVAPLERVE